jgi:hypothetical protein
LVISALSLPRSSFFFSSSASFSFAFLARSVFPASSSSEIFCLVDSILSRSACGGASCFAFLISSLALAVMPTGIDIVDLNTSSYLSEPN